MISNEVIEKITEKLVEAYNSTEIYLFGSYVWGTPDIGSDLDLFIVVDESDKKPQYRSDIGSEALWEFKVPKDILVYTKEEFNRRINDIFSLCYKIKKDGRILYARA